MATKNPVMSKTVNLSMGVMVSMAISIANAYSTGGLAAVDGNELIALMCGVGVLINRFMESNNTKLSFKKG